PFRQRHSFDVSSPKDSNCFILTGPFGKNQLHSEYATQLPQTETLVGWACPIPACGCTRSWIVLSSADRAFWHASVRTRTVRAPAVPIRRSPEPTRKHETEFHVTKRSPMGPKRNN